jgi:hypothetical protein
MAGLLALAGCSGSGNAPACRVNSDCASNACRSNGTCAPLTDAGSTPDAGPPPDAGSTTGDMDGGNPGPDAGMMTTDAGQPPLCQPRADGVVTRDLMPLGPGLHATFRIATNATANSAGDPLPDGGRAWDLSGSLPGDSDNLLTTNSLDGGWFANDFPGASYTSQLSSTADLQGVFQVTADALLLLGVVSPTQSGTYTELTYNPPVVVLQFPIQPGATWSTNSTVSGIADGVAAYYFENYNTQVDQTGEALTPFSNFAVQRVNTSLVRTVGALITGQRTFLFATGCFGGVVTMVGQSETLFSPTAEPSAEFTSASEVRRLAP